VRVVNNSWGSSGEFDPNDPISIATRKLYEAGITVVFAAGNEGPGPNTMNRRSVAPWVISVAAGCKIGVVDPTNSASQCQDANGRAPVLAGFSSRGIPGDAMYRPDITAPGVRIVAARSYTGTVMNALDATADANVCNIAIQHVDDYTCASGTSMASPVIAGVVALMVEASQGRITPDGALDALTRTARPLTGYAAWEVGAGFVDAEAAVRRAARIRK
jgi:serine protease AprX